MTLETFGQYASAGFHAFGYLMAWLACGTYALTRYVNRLSPEKKTVFVTRHARVAGFVDLLAGLGLNAPQIKRGAQMIAKGVKADAVVAVLNALEDGDADGVTLTPGLAPLKLLDLPPDTVYPPPPPPLAKHFERSERYSLVHSSRPPPPAPEAAEVPAPAMEEAAVEIDVTLSSTVPPPPPTLKDSAPPEAVTVRPMPPRPRPR